MPEIIPFPDRGAPRTDEETIERLLELHAGLTDAMLHGQDADMHMTMTLEIDDVMLLCELIEQRLGPEHFSDDPE